MNFTKFDSCPRIDSSKDQHTINTLAIKPEEDMNHETRALACGTLLLALAGCGGNDSNSSGASAAAAPRQTLSITARQDFTPGVSYASVGAYEQLSGTISGEVDPKDPKNAIIQDLELAPVNDRGMVEYSADFVMLKPKDMSKANGVLRYDAPNRGNILTMLAPAQVPGDAVYLERGYVLLYSAWQGDVPKSSAARLTLQVPVAKNKDGSAITGPYATELIISAATPVATLPNGVFNGTMIPYAPVTLDNTQPGFSLTRRINEADPREPIPAAQWKFADCSAAGGANPFPGTADPAKICLSGGFDPKYLYELSYIAKDPKVMGVGLAALRDTVSFFRSKAADAAGVANPVAGLITNTIGQGTSQSGNAMKTFLHLGFNQSLDGGKVFDGIYAHIAARQTNINTRFAVPGGGGNVRTDHRAFGQTAPRGLSPDYVDAVAGRTGGVMKRCNDNGTCPKFFLGLSGTEFWQLQGSPVLTDALGTTDLTQPSNARVYYYTATHHLNKSPAINWNPSASVYPAGNNIDFGDTFRALFIDMEDWVVRNVAPPASEVPRLADGTLVRPAQVSFPVMKGVAWPVGSTSTSIPEFQYRALVNSYTLLDFGPLYRPQDESGIPTIVPPNLLGKDYAILVPQVDPSTGMGKAGIRAVDVQAPIGTSLEFNYVATPGITDLVSLTGSYIPFHKTEAARIAAGDQRPSLESLYGTQAAYVARVRAAADDLVKRRFMLQADADRRIQAAVSSPILP